jgi:hypothetical protein
VLDLAREGKGRLIRVGNGRARIGPHAERVDSNRPATVASSRAFPTALPLIATVATPPLPNPPPSSIVD